MTSEHTQEHEDVYTCKQTIQKILQKTNETLSADSLGDFCWI